MRTEWLQETKCVALLWVHRGRINAVIIAEGEKGRETRHIIIRKISKS